MASQANNNKDIQQDKSLSDSNVTTRQIKDSQQDNSRPDPALSHLRASGTPSSNDIQEDGAKSLLEDKDSNMAPSTTDNQQDKLRSVLDIAPRSKDNQQDKPYTDKNGVSKNKDNQEDKSHSISGAEFLDEDNQQDSLSNTDNPSIKIKNDTVEEKRCTDPETKNQLTDGQKSAQEEKTATTAAQSSNVGKINNKIKPNIQGNRRHSLPNETTHVLAGKRLTQMNKTTSGMNKQKQKSTGLDANQPTLSQVLRPRKNSK